MAAMNDRLDKEGWLLPYSSPLPLDPRKRRRARLGRLAGYVLLAAALIGPAVQFQAGLVKRLRRAEEFDRRLAAGKVTPAEQRPEARKGAIGRWRKAVRQFWAGQNIYQMPPKPPLPSAGRPHSATRTARDTDKVYLHPNMPFVVMLLTPFAYMPMLVMAITYNVLKIAVIVMAILMAVRVVNHKGHRPPDWLVGLGLLWGMRLIVGDIQHANTNCFVLGGIVFHLWLYRRGRDFLAGVPLAAAICLKMTPALFILYWLYQRNWKLLAGTAVAGLVMVVLVPGIALGPKRYVETTGSWLKNLIVPGLIRNTWCPTHVNQSLSGVACRYFLTGRDGNIYWDPDHDPHYVKTDRGWITVVALPEGVVKVVVRATQVLIVALIAWAIGWRKRPRDDGRRALHYGLVVLGMMLLNQRTWGHHAAVLLIAYFAAWYAIAFGRIWRRARAWALALILAAGCCIWLTGNELFGLAARFLGEPEQAGEYWGDVFKAYGPTFMHFVLMLGAMVILTVATRRSEQPFAQERQKLRG